MKKVILQEALEQINTHWDPHVVGALNGQHVKLAKIKGTFPWHFHEGEDELFLVVEGAFDLEFRDRTIHLQAGEFCIVPRGVEHRPVAPEEASILLFEPATTLNTGNLDHALTKKDLKSL